MGGGRRVPKRQCVAASFFDEHVDYCPDEDGGAEESVAAGAVDAEIATYLKTKCLGLKEDPLHYWKVKGGAGP